MRSLVRNNPVMLAALTAMILTALAGLALAAMPPRMMYNGAPALAAEQITQGDLVMVANTNGTIQVATNTTAGVVMGVAEDSAIAGAYLGVRRGIYRLDNAGDITRAHVGSLAYVVSRSSVGVASTARLTPAGVIVDVDAYGVWVRVGDLSGLAYPDIPSSTNGLPVGALYNSSGTLKIVQ